MGRSAHGTRASGPIASRAARYLGGRNPSGTRRFRSDRVSRSRRPKLWRAQACGHTGLRHNRVSPLGAERRQDQLRGHGRGDGGRCSRGCPGRPDVILVVRSRDGTVPALPGPTTRGMPPLLTRRCPAGPLARSQPGMGTEERLAEGTTSASRSSGHRCTSQMEGATVPDASGSRSG